MPEPLNPFSGLTPGGKMTPRELTRAIRLALSAEEEAIRLYEALADVADSPLARKVLTDVANEERVHVGEFHRLLALLLPDEAGRMEEGAAEVAAILIGQGLETAFVGPAGRDYEFVVSETLALQLKEPSAVCALK
jgi:hypothetical protein